MSEATVTQPPSPSAARTGGRAARPLDLLYSETETELHAAVRDVLEDKAAWPDVLARTETPETYDSDLWRTLAAEVGVAGLLIPEDLGGAGASYREAAVVAEELGRSVAPVPFLGSAVVATTALLSAGHSALLRELACGALTAALAVPFAAAPDRLARTVRLSGARDGDEPGIYRLTGEVRGAADALPAGVLLVPADGVPFGLFAVDVAEARAAGALNVVPVVSLDQTRQLADLSFDGAPARQIAVGEQAEAAVHAALVAGAGVLASEQFGLAERALDITVAYVKERKQFARPVGGFQAIKHRLADLWVAISQARAAARAAADRLARWEEDPAETELMVALAKQACSDTALKAAQEMIQLHGGIGFTWEHPAHLFLKRAKADSIGHGTADAHRSSLARLANLPAPLA